MVANVKTLFKHIYDNLFSKQNIDHEKIKEESKKNFKPIGFLDDNLKVILEEKFKTKINNVAIFEQALTHRSYLQVLSFDKFNSNERLQFCKRCCFKYGCNRLFVCELF
ncbi:hypothetical protein MASR1M45_26230 [Candidatus Kapaibacterium sp.]